MSLIPEGSMSEGEPLVFGPGPEHAEVPPALGLPGDPADQRTPLTQLCQREQVVAERPLPLQLLRLASGVHGPDERPVVRQAQTDDRVVGGARGPLAGQLP